MLSLISTVEVEANTTSVIKVRERVESTNIVDMWLPDSGANQHISMRKDLFQTYTLASDK